MKKQKNITELRSRIDSIDDKLLDLFAKRMEIARGIAEYKKAHNIEVLNATREQEVLDRLCAKAGPEMAVYVRQLYSVIFDLSKDFQQQLIPKKKYGLIGRNLVYSFSKEIHAGLADYDYDIYNLEPEDLKEFFSRHVLSGCNVTIPYKRDVCALCSGLSEQAKKIGSVNAVIVQNDGSLYGDNTDYYGFLYMAKRAGIDFAGKKVLVFGNGATSATICAAVEDSHGELTVISRTGKDNYTNLAEHADAQVLINTTPVGTYPETENQITDIRMFPKCEAVLDVVYNPLISRFVQQGLEAGLKGSGGLPMLVAQAKKTCELFTDKTISDTETERLIHSIKVSKQNIVCIGMPGSGKSTVAKLVAQQMNRELVDIDSEIEQRERRSIPEIFEKFGENYFRARESEVIADIAKKSGIVIAAGGGAVLVKRNRYNLRQNGFIVFLQRHLDLLATEGRPLSQANGALAKLYEERLPLYREICDIEICNNSTPKAAACAIEKALEEQDN